MACGTHGCNVCRYQPIAWIGRVLAAVNGMRLGRQSNASRLSSAIATTSRSQPFPSAAEMTQGLITGGDHIRSRSRRSQCGEGTPSVSVLNLKFCLALAISGLVPSALAETMVTSHYRARSPDIAAHRTLPIGTRLLVTNPRTGRSVRIVIGTRGPFLRGRALDISHQRAKELGFGKSGVLPLETRVVSD